MWTTIPITRSINGDDTGSQGCGFGIETGAFDAAGGEAGHVEDGGAMGGAVDGVAEGAAVAESEGWWRGEGEVVGTIGWGTRCRCCHFWEGCWVERSVV